MSSAAPVGGGSCVDTSHRWLDGVLRGRHGPDRIARAPLPL